MLSKMPIRQNLILEINHEASFEDHRDGCDICRHHVSWKGYLLSVDGVGYQFATHRIGAFLL